jgi:hypothetical protein
LKDINYGVNCVVGQAYHNTYLFNKIAGNISNAKRSNPEEFKQMLLNQANLIQEELNEFIKALEDDNPIEQLDGASDCIVTVAGLMQILETRYQAESALLEVSENNLTKFVQLRNKDIQNIVQLTCEKYKKEGNPVEVVYAEEYGCLVFVDEVTRKIKKPLGYKPVDLSSFV